MNILKDKQYIECNYLSRYTTFPIYYNSQDSKYVGGVTAQLAEDAPYVVHEVKDFDTLDSLSWKYYGRPDYYWIIADFNKIRDPFVNLKTNFKALRVPSISSISFKGK